MLYTKNNGFFLAEETFSIFIVQPFIYIFLTLRQVIMNQSFHQEKGFFLLPSFFFVSFLCDKVAVQKSSDK